MLSNLVHRHSTSSHDVICLCKSTLPSNRVKKNVCDLFLFFCFFVSMSYLKLFIHKLIMACISVERECFETSLRPSVGGVRHAFVWKKCCLWLFIQTYVVVFHRYSSHLLIQILRHIAFVASDIQPFNYGVYWVRLSSCAPRVSYTLLCIYKQDLHQDMDRNQLLCIKEYVLC